MGNTYIAHANGEWKNHKYIRKEGDRYIYGPNPTSSATAGLTAPNTSSIKNTGRNAATSYTDANRRSASGMRNDGGSGRYSNYRKTGTEGYRPSSVDRRTPLDSSGQHNADNMKPKTERTFSPVHANLDDLEERTQAREERSKAFNEAINEINEKRKPSSKEAVVKNLKRLGGKTLGKVAKTMGKARKKIESLVGAAKNAASTGVSKARRAINQVKEYAISKKKKDYSGGSKIFMPKSAREEQATNKSMYDKLKRRKY